MKQKKIMRAEGRKKERGVPWEKKKQEFEVSQKKETNRCNLRCGLAAEKTAVF